MAERKRRRPAGSADGHEPRGSLLALGSRSLSVLALTSLSRARRVERASLNAWLPSPACFSRAYTAPLAHSSRKLHPQHAVAIRVKARAGSASLAKQSLVAGHPCRPLSGRIRQHRTRCVQSSEYAPYMSALSGPAHAPPLAFPSLLLRHFTGWDLWRSARVDLRVPHRDRHRSPARVRRYAT